MPAMDGYLIPHFSAMNPAGKKWFNGRNWKMARTISKTVCKLIIVKLQPVGIGNIILGIPRSRHQDCPRVLVSNLGIYQPHVPRCQRRRVIFISNGFTEFPQLIKLTRFGTRLSESGEHGFDVQDIQQRQWSGIRRINHSTPSESFHADDCEGIDICFQDATQL